MGISVFFFITWLICTFFAVIEKKLSLIENTFIFLLVLVININYSWIIIEELKRITLTTNGLEFTAYLLHRSIMTPMLAITILNMVCAAHERGKSILYFVVFLALSFGISLLQEYFHITVYTHWDFRYDLIYYFVLYLIAYYAYKLFRRATYNEVENV
ncbi:MAG TPA: hypothetical protein VLK78_03570 [Candidatus Angelobacter sp.]|nr:hypothetical protein [Candidatus Angelobacter sp.]